MKHFRLAIRFLAGLAGAMAATVISASSPHAEPEWMTVINNNDLMPPLEVRNFNSYNQPSVNQKGLVVIRARSRGGPPLGQPTHGIYTRDMSMSGSPVISILDRTSQVPDPNNLATTFVETPSFPRIDMLSDTLATRANHPPVWRYLLDDGTETRAGTTGIYTNPYGALITGASNLGHVPDYSFLEVPEYPGIRFEVFPGAPSVTQGDTIVFKGNYTTPDGVGRTGIYFRQLANEAVGGASPVVMIANNADVLIPGTTSVFGSTSPPSAAGDKVVFAGFDDEDAPTLGGIYLAELQYQPSLHTLVSIGGKVPGESVKQTFNNLGEGGAFDGRFVGFWGSWGNETRTVRLYCPAEGNRDRIAYCNRELVCEDTVETLGDPNSICDDQSDPNYGISCYQEKEVPASQGIFVHDIATRSTRVVAKTGEPFDDFLFWNYSGKTPCVGSGHSDEGSEDVAEPARWRSSAFVAVSGRSGSTFRAAFKARTGELVNGVYADPVDGIYLREGPGKSSLLGLVETGMDGQRLDPEAPAGSVVTELGIEREGLRGNWLTINASMGIEGGTEEEGMAGIYITRLPRR